MSFLRATFAVVQQSLLALLHFLLPWGRGCQGRGAALESRAAAHASREQSHKPQPLVYRRPNDALRRRPGLARSHSVHTGQRMWRLHQDWVHVIYLINGPDDNPYNPHTVTQVAGFCAQTFAGLPAVWSLERSARLTRGGLHVHAVVPAGAAILTTRTLPFQTPNGVTLQARRWKVIPVRPGLDNLIQVLEYLHKPTHAGASWFRATGPQSPQYHAGEAALLAGLEICRTLGLSRLCRTLRTQNLGPGRTRTPGSLQPRPTPLPAPQENRARMPRTVVPRPTGAARPVRATRPPLLPIQGDTDARATDARADATPVTAPGDPPPQTGACRITGAWPALNHVATDWPGLSTPASPPAVPWVLMWHRWLAIIASLP